MAAVGREAPAPPPTRAAEPPPAYRDLRARRFRVPSRGDRVPGRLLLPPRGPGPFALVWLQHGAGGHKEAPDLEAIAGPWVQGGLAVASIDLPLHGERSDAKLSRRLAAELAEPHPGASPLATEFARQALADLDAALGAAAAWPEIDPRRMAYAGLGLGASLGARFCARDPRPRAAVLDLAGGAVGPEALDPAPHLAAFAPRPLLLVAARDDPTVPRRAAQALLAAAAPPVEKLWIDSARPTLPGVAIRAMEAFLVRHLAPAPPA